MDNSTKSQSGVPSAHIEKVVDANGIPNDDPIPLDKQDGDFDADTTNLRYTDAEHEPQLHLRTWIALGSMWLYNLALLFALNSPAAVISYIGTSLDAPKTETWVINALTLPQCVLAPLISSVSDVYQVRKPILVGACIVSFVGAAIAPGSQSIYRLIGAQIMISIGFSCAPLGYAIPSEILPRKWRPMGQVCINTAAAIGACAGPLIIGAFTQSDKVNGWRKFWWVEMALWGVTALGIQAGYQPPKRHTRYDHLSLWQKIGHIDLVGFLLFAAGLSLFLVGLSLGGSQYTWTSGLVLGTMASGLAILLCLGLYEWKGTSQGFLHHDLFRGRDGLGRTFAIAAWLLFVEGVMLFSYIAFFPILNTALFTNEPFILVAREQPFWIAAFLSTAPWGLISTRFRRVKEPLGAAFVILTGGIVGLATIQPDDELNTLIFAGLPGIGFGGLIILIVTAVQLSTPHHLIATATAVTVSSRSVAGSVFTAIYVASFQSRLEQKLPSYVAAAAVKAGLPQASLKAFVTALASNQEEALQTIPGLTPAIVLDGVAALKHAYADSIRVVYIIAAAFGPVALISCWFMADLTKTMDYQVDAPVEVLKTKTRAGNVDDLTEG